MSKLQTHRRVGQVAIAVSSTKRVELPRNHWLGALRLHFAAIVSTSAGAVTIVDTTLGVLPMVKRVQLQLDGRLVPLNISGRFLDYWGHFDRPGSERLALSSTTSAEPWDSVLTWEVAQSVANLAGAIPLWKYGTAVVEVEFDAIATIASGTNIAISGNMDVYAELYRQDKGLIVDESVIHGLTQTQIAITATGENKIEIPTGRFLERLLIIAENNALLSWALLDSITFAAGTGDEPYKLTTPMFRKLQRELYGGDDVEITGAYVLDLRRAGARDIMPLGDPEIAPDPELIVDVSTTPTLTNAKVYVIAEELIPVRQAAAA